MSSSSSSFDDYDDDNDQHDMVMDKDDNSFIEIATLLCIKQQKSFLHSH